MVELFDFGVTTIFAREVLEAAIIIGEFRTIILRAGGVSVSEGEKRKLLRAINDAAIGATIVAILACVAVAIPLAVLSKDFDSKTTEIIEGASKLVAAICILQLSLKLPGWLGIYKSRKVHISDAEDVFDLTINSIRFNVAWNIWREVGECGVFLIPFFLHGEQALVIPLSAVIGTIVGLLAGWGLYYANSRIENKRSLAIFSSSLLHLLSAGLFSSGCHIFETVYGSTSVVWVLHGNFWSVDRLPMTFVKPFGYTDYRTVLQICCFWGWIVLGLLLHYRKWRITKQVMKENAEKNSPAPSTADGAMSDADQDDDNNLDIKVATAPSIADGANSDADQDDIELAI